MSGQVGNRSIPPPPWNDKDRSCTGIRATGVKAGDVRLIGLGGTWQPIGLTTHHVGAISGSRKLLNCPDLRLRFANIGKGLDFRNQKPNLGEEA